MPLYCWAAAVLNKLSLVLSFELSSAHQKHAHIGFRFIEQHGTSLLAPPLDNSFSISLLTLKPELQVAALPVFSPSVFLRDVVLHVHVTHEIHSWAAPSWVWDPCLVY